MPLSRRRLFDAQEAMLVSLSKVYETHALEVDLPMEETRLNQGFLWKENFEAKLIFLNFPLLNHFPP